MRIVVQRVSHASVTIEGQCKSSIGKGMLILVGIEESDGQEDIDWLCKKIVNLRIFDDESGVMNKSILEDGGDGESAAFVVCYSAVFTVVSSSASASSLIPTCRSILIGIL